MKKRRNASSTLWSFAKGSSKLIRSNIKMHIFHHKLAVFQSKHIYVQLNIYWDFNTQYTNILKNLLNLIGTHTHLTDGDLFIECTHTSVVKALGKKFLQYWTGTNSIIFFLNFPILWGVGGRENHRGVVQAFYSLLDKHFDDTCNG